MSKSNVLYVKGMDMPESDEDIWDDSLLINAMDKAQMLTNSDVAKRIAMATNSRQGHKNKKEKPQSKQNKKKMQWKVGMPCRAIYDGDGLEYEATVMQMINDTECVVRFVGYNNSEVVQIDKLKPTLGKEEQAMQIEQALLEHIEEPTESDGAPSMGSTERSFDKRNKSKKKKNSRKSSQPANVFDLPEIPMPNLNMLRNLGSVEMPMPPMPPPPLAMPSGMDSEDQAVSSMLLSWYMSGYYTGLYQGLKRAKESRRSK